MRLRFLPLVVWLVAAFAVAKADPITYNVNVSSSGATATGSITTDGVTGNITILDITDFTLTLTDGVNTSTFSTADFSGGDSENGFADGSFVATTSGLFFNFSAARGDFLSFFNLGGDQLCFAASAWACNTSIVSEQSATIISLAGVDHPTFGQTGLQQIAAVPTPEPSSLALLGTGILGVVGAMRRRFV